MGKYFLEMPSYVVIQKSGTFEHSRSGLFSKVEIVCLVLTSSMRSRYRVKHVESQDKLTIYEPRFLDCLWYASVQMLAMARFLERVRDDGTLPRLGRRLSVWGRRLI